MSFLQQWESLGGGERGGHRRLLLTEDGQRANLAFVTDLPDGVARRIHYSNGNRMVACTGDECVECANGNRSRRMGYFWVYVFDILSPTQPKSGNAEQVKTSSGAVMWRENVGDLRLLQANVSMVDGLRGQYEIYGTLLGHKFVLIRRGASRDINTSYTWAVTGQAEIPPEALKEVPNLEEVVDNILRRREGEAEDKRKAIVSALEEL